MEQQNIFDRGVAKVKSVVSEVSIEQREFVKSITRICHEGWLQGWHESNGGNLSYRMTPDEVASCRSYFSEAPGEWIPLGIQAQGLQNEYFVVTSAGSQFRAALLEPSATLGIVEISPGGDTYRPVWGFKGGRRPTSEFASHFMNHAVRKGVSGGTNRVIYHAHPANAIALSAVLPGDSKVWSRVMWQSLTESILALPEGIAVVSKAIPGTTETAEETSRLMEEYSSVVWAHHGVFCAAADVDSAFGLMHIVDKAAAIYLKACAACGGAKKLIVPNDDELNAIAKAFSVTLKL